MESAQINNSLKTWKHLLDVMMNENQEIIETRQTHYKIFTAIFQRFLF